MTDKIIAGIDYSLTSPAICIGKTKNFEDSVVYAFGSKTKVGQYDNISIEQKIEYVSNIDRYNKLAQWSLEKLLNHNVTDVYIEGYSYGSRGRATLNIAENGGILRYVLYKAGMICNEVPPKSLKSFACNHGNASKEMMYSSFVDYTGEDFISEFQKNVEKIGNPTSDIVDAYFIMSYGVDNALETIQ